MSSLNSLRLFIDVHKRQLVSSPFDPSSPTLPTFVSDDIINMEVYPLMPNIFNGLGGNPFDPITDTTLFTSALANLGPVSVSESTVLASDASLTAEQKLFSAEVITGGSDYNIGDILTITNGTTVESAKVEVTAVESNKVTAVSIVDEGAYTSGIAQPATGYTTGIHVTGDSSATGCKLKCLFAQTFVGKLDLTSSGIDTTVIDSTTKQGTTNIEVRIKNGGSGAALRYTTILQQEITIKENIMDAE